MGHILWLGEVRLSSPCFVNLNCAQVGLFLVPHIGFCFVGLPFFPSASWPLSFLSLFFLFLRPCFIHTRMPEMGRVFFAWTHFLAFMEWADDIGSRPAAWSYVPVQCSSFSLRVFYMILVDGKDTY